MDDRKRWVGGIVGFKTTQHRKLFFVQMTLRQI